jgi:hypothetical protein
MFSVGVKQPEFHRETCDRKIIFKKIIKKLTVSGMGVCCVESVSNGQPP